MQRFFSLAFWILILLFSGAFILVLERKWLDDLLRWLMWLI